MIINGLNSKFLAFLLFRVTPHDLFAQLHNAVMPVVFILGASARLPAQEYIELGQLGYRYSFRTSAESDSIQGSSVQGARVNVLVPVKLSDKTYLLPGFRFWQYHLDPGENLKWYLFQVGIQTQLSGKLSLQFLPLLRSGIYQDAGFGEGFQLGLLAVVNNRIKENLTLGYGLYTNHELFGQLLTPVLGIDWQITDRWRLFGNFPLYNTLAYQINPKFNTGLNYVGLITSFQGDKTYIERISLDFSYFLEYYITSQIVVQARLGYPLARTFEEYNEKDRVDFSFSLLRFGEHRSLVSSFDEANWFVGLHLFFRVSTDRKVLQNEG